MQKLKRKTILKEAGVLLIAAVMILSAVTVTANTIKNNDKNPLIETFATFTEGFEDGLMPPTDWLNIDYDGDGFLWKSVVPPGMPPHSGDFSAGSESWDEVTSTPLTPDNWLITPGMRATDSTELSYWVAAQDPAYAEEHIEVWISTSGTTVPDDFTDQVDDYTCPAGSSDWVERIVDLSSYDGEIIYIAFRHCDTYDMFWIKIDDITVSNVEFGEPLVAEADGPYEAFEDEPIQFQGSAEGGVPPYSFHWDFDDGDTSDIQNPMHAYTNTGNYTVTLTVTDDESDTASDTTWALINNPPSAPDISGAEEGEPGESYSYYFTSTDPDGDDVSYFIDWGDGETTGWTPYRTSGVMLKEDHEFSEYGTFIIKAKAKDIYNAESDWGELEIAMPRNRVVNRPFLQFLQQYPILYQLLLRFLGL